jgi:hypothetical protein
MAFVFILTIAILIVPFMIDARLHDKNVIERSLQQLRGHPVVQRSVGPVAGGFATLARLPEKIGDIVVAALGVILLIVFWWILISVGSFVARVVRWFFS